MASPSGNGSKRRDIEVEVDMDTITRFSDEELRRELDRRRNEKISAYKATNLDKNKRLTCDIVDFVAPEHSKKDLSACNKSSALLVDGYSHCNRCSLESMRRNPDTYSDVNIGITIDFAVSKQLSFK